MYKEIIDSRRNSFDAVVENFKKEMAKIRTGRANPALVEDITVEYYGTPTPLKQVANISVPEPRQIAIAPWDVDTVVNVVAALKKAELGVVPQVDANVVRLTLPPLNEEQRRELVKVLGKKAEEARIGIRTIREEIWREISAKQKEGEITEDEKFLAKEELQAVVDAYNGDIEQLRQAKEEEIMTV